MCIRDRNGHDAKIVMSSTFAASGGMSAWGGSSYGEGARGQNVCSSDITGNSGSNGCVMIFGF